MGGRERQGTEMGEAREVGYGNYGAYGQLGLRAALASVAAFF